MPAPTFAKKEDVPEAFRDSYIERDGKWVFDDTEFAGLQANQRRLLDEKKKADTELRRLKESLGDKDPDEIAALLKAKKDAEEENARKAGDFDKLLKKREDEVKAEYEKRLAEVTPYKGKFEDRELDLAIRKAAGLAKVREEAMDDVVDLLRGKRIKLDEKTGKPVVLDKDGDPTGLTVEKFFSDTYKTERPGYYQGASGSGGGAGAGGSGNRTVPAGEIDASDNAAFLANIDKIAKGEVKVTTAE